MSAWKANPRWRTFNHLDVLLSGNPVDGVNYVGTFACPLRPRRPPGL